MKYDILIYEPHYEKTELSLLCENIGADHLCNNFTADQHLCFHFWDRIIPLLLKSKISIFYSSSVTVQASLCWTWLETLKTGFLDSAGAYMSKIYLPGRLKE